MNPHKHIPFCQFNASIAKCCVACKWAKPEWAKPATVVIPKSWEERITPGDAYFLKELLIQV